MTRIGQASPLSEIRHEILLGEDNFIFIRQPLQQSEDLVETVRVERAANSLSLEDYRIHYPDRVEAMAGADLSTALTTRKVAVAFGMSVKTVSRAGQLGKEESGAIEPRLRPPVTPDNQFAVSDFKMFNSLMSG